jgi:hypothetical protein
MDRIKTVNPGCPLVRKTLAYYCFVSLFFLKATTQSPGNARVNENDDQATGP